MPEISHPCISRRPVASARLRRLVLGACLFATTLPGLVAGAPPAAPSRPAQDVLHGVKVDDPYRNLESIGDPQTRAWLDAQGAHAAAALGRIEGRNAMVRRLEELSRASGDSVRAVTRMPGDRIYYLKRRSGEDQYKLVLRIGTAGAERVLVDPQKLRQATGRPHAINYYAPSWDGRMLAYGISAGGSEDASLHLLNIASGKALGQPIPRVRENLVRWAPDSRHLTYNQGRELSRDAPPTETFLDTTVYVIEAGRPESRARPLFGPLVDKGLGLERIDNGGIVFAPGSRYMIARTTDTTAPEGKLYVAPLASLGEDRVAWRQISAFADKITDVALRGDTLFLRTYAGAPRGRVLALALADPVLAQAREVVPEPAKGVLSGFAPGPDGVHAEVQAGFTTRTRLYGDKTAAQGDDIAPSVSGSTYLVDEPAHAQREPWVVTSSWTAPPQVLAINVDGIPRDTGLIERRLPPGAPELEISEVMVPSHDGVEIPLAVVRRKGLLLDGRNPTLLRGYGAYGQTTSAWYDPQSVAWFERGGVVAWANVRGSGAFGDAWYRAGFKTTKPNTWKDGIAAARYLIGAGYASPKTLGIWGTSAGGIFVGRAVTTAPELFAAAVFDVGVLDAIRSENSANGITNISEFGTVADPGEFKALLEMSTYHHIVDGAAYPAVLLIHGLNDPRVDFWQSAKTAARLQKATSSGRPVLLRLDAQAGHGIGSTAEQGRRKLADVYSFLLWQFGVVRQK